MPKRFLLRLLPMCLLAAPNVAAAQEEPAAGFEGLVEVTEVLLDVLVTDRSGHAVAGLSKEDFVVEEDGGPVKLTGASFYTTRYGPRGEPLAHGEVPASRYFIFFFHNRPAGGSIRNYAMRQRLTASRASQRWVEELMLPSDWVAVVSYDSRLKVHRDFTQDRHALDEAIVDAVRGVSPEKGLGRRARPMPPSGAPSLLRHLPQGKELRRQSDRIYDGLRLLAEAAAYVVGRKNLVLFSIGFDAIAIGSLYPDPELHRYRVMEEAANDANVAVYAVDLTPIEVEQTGSFTLARLAGDTGGAYFGDSTSFLRPLRRISVEAGGYYLLSYQSEHPADEAGFQEVVVRVRDRALRVRARRGYRYGSGDG